MPGIIGGIPGPGGIIPPIGIMLRGDKKNFFFAVTEKDATKTGLQ